MEAGVTEQMFQMMCVETPSASCPYASLESAGRVYFVEHLKAINGSG